MTDVRDWAVWSNGPPLGVPDGRNRQEFRMIVIAIAAALAGASLSAPPTRFEGAHVYSGGAFVERALVVRDGVVVDEANAREGATKPPGPAPLPSAPPPPPAAPR